VPQLASRTYHNKLGSDLDRVERLRRLACRIQAMLPRGEKGRPYADRAALLAKADLVTLMVGEFPELQGVMGKYYAEADGEEPSVVRAIEQHYWPRFSGDQLPVGDVSIAAGARRQDRDAGGHLGRGQQPTGDKDPFGLRRAALGVLRILVEKVEPTPRSARLLDAAVRGFPRGGSVAATPWRVPRLHARPAALAACATRATTQRVEAVLAEDSVAHQRRWKRI
jgi:glycyl-tRNA synthetase beta chain